MDSQPRWRLFSRRTAGLWAAMMWLVVIAVSSAPAQHASAPIQGQANNGGIGPYVDSTGVRLRDFPSIGEGRVLAVLPDGRGLQISAVTDWRDQIDGASFPWYHASLVDGSSLVGWVYGEFVSFPPGSALNSESVQTVSHQQMNRSLLVLEMFRRLLGSDSHKVATSWLHGLPEAGAAQPLANFPTEYSFREYRSDFGKIVVRYNPYDKQQLVLSITLDRPRSGLLVTIGEPISRVLPLLGSDYYLVGPVRMYRGIPGLDSYEIGIQSKNGVVTGITASVLID